MKVELERITTSGERTIRLIANDDAKNPNTVRSWIRMLQIAERWLREGKKNVPAGNL